jgi:hypothetical protein
LVSTWKLNTSKKWRLAFVCPCENKFKYVLSGMPGALGILLGVEPTAAVAGKGRVEAGGALTTMDERGTAVGFCDSTVKVGE